MNCNNKKPTEYENTYVNGIYIMEKVSKGVYRVRYSCGCVAIRDLSKIKLLKGTICKMCIDSRGSRLKHGYKRKNVYNSTYKSWTGMKSRCYRESNPSYKDYGGRGITVHDRWLDSFENFLEDMGECPPNKSIERVDFNGNYTPSNCVWADMKTQANNKRNNIRISNGVEVMSLMHWCGVLGINYKYTHKGFRYKQKSIEELLGDEYHLVVNTDKGHSSEHPKDLK